MCTAESHRAMKADPTVWHSLPLLGHQRFDFDDGEPPTMLEMRNCDRPGCNSTLAIEIQIVESARAAG